LLLSVGVDAAYNEDTFFLKVKIGPFRINLVPGKEKGEEKKEKPKKKEKKKVDKTAKTSQKKKAKLKLKFDDIKTILRIALDALGRFRRSISVDFLKLHILVGGGDPYSAVMNYGYINSAIGGVIPLLHRVFKVKKEDIGTDMDFDGDKLKVDGQAVLSVRIWEILLIVFCAGYAFIKWFISYKRRNKPAKETNKEITEDTSAEKGN
ncbi:MAG: DUF2953 domain-containing protein, partial [Oscillospiraceae bacterium]|nr:DUF2953 domain-containing protein [Oscillospiraceae bacterium]